MATAAVLTAMSMAVPGTALLLLGPSPVAPAPTTLPAGPPAASPAPQSLRVQTSTEACLVHVSQQAHLQLLQVACAAVTQALLLAPIPAPRLVTAPTTTEPGKPASHAAGAGAVAAGEASLTEPLQVAEPEQAETAVTWLSRTALPTGCQGRPSSAVTSARHVATEWRQEPTVGSEPEDTALSVTRATWGTRTRRAGGLAVAAVAEGAWVAARTSLLPTICSLAASRSRSPSRRAGSRSPGWMQELAPWGARTHGRRALSSSNRAASSGTLTDSRAVRAPRARARTCAPQARSPNSSKARSRCQDPTSSTRGRSSSARSPTPPAPAWLSGPVLTRSGALAGAAVAASAAATWMVALLLPFLQRYVYRYAPEGGLCFVLLICTCSLPYSV